MNEQLEQLQRLMDQHEAAKISHDHERLRGEISQAVLEARQREHDQAIAQLKRKIAELQGAMGAPFTPVVGAILAGRYHFERKLGEGGNGEVWKVREQAADGKQVYECAIKLLKRDVLQKPHRLERFLKEISLARRLIHPHIIRLTHWDRIGGQFYAVMDYIPGSTLRALITGRTFSDQETVQLLRPIAEALDYAHHKQRIVHRDVKPENILVQQGHLYLGDFGLAISPDEDEGLSESGEWVGTKKYMAPEQWEDQAISPQTDLYALTLIAYELLTGVFPYDASSHARLLQQHLNAPLPAHERLPAEVLAILRRGAAKDPIDRYASATEFISELAHWQYHPTDLETRIRKYRDRLRTEMRGEVYEQLFVDLEGESRPIIAVASSKPPEADPYLADLLKDFVIDLDADHHQPQTAKTDYVPNILERLAQCQRVVLVGEPARAKALPCGAW